MYHVFKKFKYGQKISLSLLKRKWEITIEYYNFNCLFGCGWSVCAKELELCLGDTCILEPTDNPCEFNICVFRHEKYDFAMFKPGRVLLS